MPPKGFRRGLPPPGYVFKEKKIALKYQGLSPHSGTIPLAHTSMYSSSSSPTRPKKTATNELEVKKKGRGNQNRARDLKRAKDRRVRDASGVARFPARRRRTSQGGEKSVDQEVEDEWRDDERRMETVEGELTLEEEDDDEDDPVWTGFREDHYKIVDQLPLELHRTYELIHQLEGQVEDTKEEIQVLVRAYVETRRGRGFPLTTATTTSSLLTPHAQPTIANKGIGGIFSNGHQAMEIDVEIGGSAAAARLDDASTRPVESSSDQLTPPTAITFPPAAKPAILTSINTSPPPSQPLPLLDLHSYTLSSSSSSQPPQPLPHPASSSSTLIPPLAQPQPQPQPSPPTLTSLSRTQLLKLASLLTLLLQTSSHKVVLAKDSYDRVDRQIRELDLALNAHRASMSEGPLLVSSDGLGNEEDDATRRREDGEVGFGFGEKLGTVMEVDESGVGGGKEERVYDSEEDAIGEEYDTEEELVEDGWQQGSMVRETSGGSGGGDKGKRVAFGERGGNGAGGGAAGGGEGRGGGGMVLENALVGMAVDPNEPRYCYCNGVSYGEMIACDNEDCETEWFHVGCVGVLPPAKKLWFCRDCSKGVVSRRRGGTR